MNVFGRQSVSEILKAVLTSYADYEDVIARASINQLERALWVGKLLGEVTW